MMTMVRGSNPIWYEVDLTAHAFDDTFYMFVLDNEIPYAPLPTWQDPFGNVAWDNPIRFLANGTLPNNLYFDPDTVYRLEFRQGNTQSDPLIYLVENYVPGSSGNTPINETSFSTDNQVSNPQFALINFTSPLTLNSISTQIINVAPDWFLNLTGTGTAIITQVPLNSTVINPTNASYALQIQLSGSWTNAYLSQRFTKNGVLWSNSFVSSSIMALSGNAPQIISAKLFDSQGNTLTTVLPTISLTEEFNVYPGIGQIGASMDTDFPPTAYIEYQLLLPNNCNITLSSVQLISGDVNIEYPYEQTTIERQIDQTYHNAYPIVPVGTIIDFGGFGTPKHYLPLVGGAYSRIAFNQLFNTITATETVTLTSSSATFIVASGAKYRIGMGLEGTGIPAFTTIIGISTNTITMSSPASISGSSIVRFFAAAPEYIQLVNLVSTNTFTASSASNLAAGMAITGNGIPAATIVTNVSGTTITISNAATITAASIVTFYGVGNGDGSTTFNVYDTRDLVIAGAAGSIFGSLNGNGAQGGFATHLMTIAEMPSHNHPGSTTPMGAGALVNGAGGNASVSLLGTPTGITVAAQGGSTPFSIVQPTMLMNKFIRYE